MNNQWATVCFRLRSLKQANSGKPPQSLYFWESTFIRVRPFMSSEEAFCYFTKTICFTNKPSNLCWSWQYKHTYWNVLPYECNNSNHPITWTPALFQENWLIIVFQAFEHPRLKLLFHYLNAYTFWNLNGGHQTSTTLWQSLRSYSEGYQMSSSILQAFSNIY